MSTLKRRIKRVWEGLPLAADLEWQLYRRHRMHSIERYEGLRTVLAEWTAQTPTGGKGGKKVFLFSMIYLWIQYVSSLGLTLSGMGHEVTFSYLPYGDWFSETNRFRNQLQNHYFRAMLQPLASRMRLLPMLGMSGNTLPPALLQQIEDLSYRDLQYTRQVEEVDKTDPLYQLRLQRNRTAAEIFLGLLQKDRPDVVVVPNGMILEFGALFQVARFLEIPVVSFEFGEQRDRIWIAQDKSVMYQDTREMWERYKDQPFTRKERDRIEELFASRQNASLWQQFSRQWQEVPTEGIQAVKEKVGLDDRPVVLMAANVIGDSLTLKRQVFSANMTEWIQRTLEYFSDKPQIQFVLRIHPGERYTDGPSVEDIVRQKFTSLPDHLHIISAQDPINTYDLVAVADLGLTYTTTVGMEMAMSGLPVIVSGNTHYRGKGFTLDPDSWDTYFSLLDSVIESPGSYRLEEAQQTLAWHYAYRFFFNYPFPSPWHLRGIREMMTTEGIADVLSPEGLAKYGEMYNYLIFDGGPDDPQPRQGRKIGK
ncbi:MAG TPA: hypothetical protein VLA32_07225 [Anaerolineales bacterium]|jgi:hypothetical protein|nr:hypothetical protein [Anaerolineales bacterium]